MHYTYKTKGVCARTISFDIEDEIVTNIKFEGGCNGNTQGIAMLAEGMKAEDIISKTEGLKCGFKSTSCPDQLSKAVKEAVDSISD